MSLAIFSLANFYKKAHAHGPLNGSESFLQYWIVIPLIIVGAVIVFYLYRFRFPKLSSIQPTSNLKEQMTRHKEEVVSDQSRCNNQDVVDANLSTEEASSIDVVLRLLETDESKVVKALLEAGGSLLQKDISWKTGFSRVKTHRVLVRLLRRDVVTSEKYYNTNRITLSEWIQHTTN